MREIKFRAWDKSTKKMYYEGFSISCTGQSDSDGGVYFSGRIFKKYNPLEIEYMQFTGLLDKNGKEIYEGDVMEWVEDPEDYFRGEVVFEEVAFAIKGQDNLNSLNYDEFVIIGNIYENPELLKENEK